MCLVSTPFSLLCTSRFFATRIQTSFTLSPALPALSTSPVPLAGWQLNIFLLSRKICPNSKVLWFLAISRPPPFGLRSAIWPLDGCHRGHQGVRLLRARGRWSPQRSNCPISSNEITLLITVPPCEFLAGFFSRLVTGAWEGGGVWPTRSHPCSAPFPDWLPHRYFLFYGPPVFCIFFPKLFAPFPESFFFAVALTPEFRLINV